MNGPTDARRVATIAVVAVATLLLMFALWEARAAVLLLVLALGTASATEPAVDALTRARVPRGLALALTYAVGLTVFGAVAYVVGVELVGELERGTDHLLAGYDRLQRAWADEPGVRGLLAERLPPAASLYRAVGRSDLGEIAEGAVDTTLGILDVLAHAVAVLALALYWAARREQILHGWLKLIPRARRAGAEKLWRRTTASMGAQLRGALARTLMTVLVCSLAFRGLGLAYWALPSVTVGLAHLFPLVGILFATGAAALAGAVEGPLFALAAAATALGAHLMFDRLLVRRLLRAEPTNPILAVLIAMLLVGRFGLAGLLAAPLFAAAVQPLLAALLIARAGSPTATERLSALDEQVRELRHQLDDAELSPLLAQLEGLVAAARAPLEATGPQAPACERRIGGLADSAAAPPGA